MEILGDEETEIVDAVDLEHAGQPPNDEHVARARWFHGGKPLEDNGGVESSGKAGERLSRSDER